MHYFILIIFITSILSAGESRPQWNQFPLDDEARQSWLKSLYEEDLQKQNEVQSTLGALDCYYFYRLTRQVQELDSKGEQVRLADGSLWTIHPRDRAKFLFWGEPLRVYVTQNSDFTRRTVSDIYPYKLVNFDRNQSVRVQLIEAPVYADCERIVAIDKVKKKISLESGSLWKVSSYDRDILQTWEPGDFILMGANTRWNRRSKAYLLVNISRNTMVRAKEK